ncbi:Re/Si-specific NAD(P)(+) transhydrogenase subunit beta, partial [Rhizobium sp. SEMIA 4085]|uniref:NAD(P)(+) transhydrogenase (Re/Si-specific) subunit beta n=1 Tax=Rhizobium sp. SEMIA 4085 TaxID=2137761 RepID=UPI001478848D
MSIGIQTAAYIAASVLFILALGGLSGQESAKRAVWYGIVGMAIAAIATVFGPGVGLSTVLIGMLVFGAVIGAVMARRVEMTGMPQLVAALHSFVCLSAAVLGLHSHLTVREFSTQAAHHLH